MKYFCLLLFCCSCTLTKSVSHFSVISKNNKALEILSSGNYRTGNMVETSVQSLPEILDQFPDAIALINLTITLKIFWIPLIYSRLDYFIKGTPIYN